jgi:hypothetical protein
MRRLIEPSTWAGVGVLLQVVKPMLPVVYQPLADALTAAAGTAAAALTEKKA